MELSKEVQLLLERIKKLTKREENNGGETHKFNSDIKNDNDEDLIDVDQFDFSDNEKWLYVPESSSSNRNHFIGDLKAWLRQDMDHYTSDTKRIDTRTFTRPKKRFSRPTLEETSFSPQLSEEPIELKLTEPVYNNKMFNSILLSADVNMDSFRSISPPPSLMNSMSLCSSSTFTLLDVSNETNDRNKTYTAPGTSDLNNTTFAVITDTSPSPSPLNVTYQKCETTTTVNICNDAQLNVTVDHPNITYNANNGDKSSASSTLTSKTCSINTVDLDQIQEQYINEQQVISTPMVTHTKVPKLWNEMELSPITVDDLSDSDLSDIICRPNNVSSTPKRQPQIKQLAPCKMMSRPNNSGLPRPRPAVNNAATGIPRPVSRIPAFKTIRPPSSSSIRPPSKQQNKMNGYY